jgi:hypothetical protein
MGFTYSKSVNLGPFRGNLSKSGLGYSVGAVISGSAQRLLEKIYELQHTQGPALCMKAGKKANPKKTEEVFQLE